MATSDGDSVTSDDQTLCFDEKRINWLKMSMALDVLKGGLYPVLDKKFKDFHSDLKRKLNPMCIECENGDQECDNKSKWKRKENCDNCRPWIDAVNKELINSSLKENTDLSKWPESSWEIAKFFLPRGHDQDKGPEDCDESGLLTLLQNCKFLRQLRKEAHDLPAKCKDVKNMRNRFSHPKNFRKMKTREMEKNLLLMISFFDFFDWDFTETQVQLAKLITQRLEVKSEDETTRLDRELRRVIKLFQEQDSTNVELLDDMYSFIYRDEEIKKLLGPFVSVLMDFKQNEKLQQELDSRISKIEEEMALSTPFDYEDFEQQQAKAFFELQKRNDESEIFDDIGRLYDELVKLLQEPKEAEERKNREIREIREIRRCPDLPALDFANDGKLRQKEGCWHLVIIYTEEVVRFTEEVYQELTHEHDEGMENSERVKIFCDEKPKIVIRHL